MEEINLMIDRISEFACISLKLLFKRVSNVKTNIGHFDKFYLLALPKMSKRNKWSMLYKGNNEVNNLL